MSGTLQHLVIAPVVLPLLTGALLLLIGPTRLALQRAVSIVATFALGVTAILLLRHAASGETLVYLVGNWKAPFGIALMLDRLSALMLVLTSAVALASLFAACNSTDTRGAYFHPLFQFQLMGLNGAFLTADLFNLFVFFEVLLICSYGLLLHAGGQERLRAGLANVVLNLTASCLFLIAVSMLYAVTGTLNLADLHVKVAQVAAEDQALLRAAGYVLLVVFCAKAALLPLNLWLPSTYRAAWPAVAALFAIMTKVGVYAVIRVFTGIFGADAHWVWDVLFPLALATLAVGAIGAFAASSLGQLAAYLVIVSSGTLFAGIALAGPANLGAALFYLVHTTLASAAMFLLIGVIAAQRGAAADRLAYAAERRHASGIAAMFVIAAMISAGLPPLSGFVAKVAILKHAWPHGSGAWLMAALLGASFLVIVSLARAGSRLFWNVSPSLPPAASRAREWLPIGALLAASIAISVFADPLQRFAYATGQQLHQAHTTARQVLATPAVDHRRGAP